MNIKALLFDLDGTLIDTAPDLVASVQELMTRHGRTALDYHTIRPAIPNGSPAMVKVGFPDVECAETLERLRLELFDIYTKHLLNQPKLYEGLEEQIRVWEDSHRPWGIVTNKPTEFTEPMLKHLGLDTRIAVLVCGNTLSTRKPDPDTLLHAAHTLSLAPDTCLYVGDDQRDLIACRKANMPCAIAAYDYIPEGENPEYWGADAVLWHTSELSHTIQSLETME